MSLDQPTASSITREDTCSIFQKSADGRIKTKDQVTITACSNASEMIKFSLQVIGKAKKPKSFKGVNMKLLAVQYEGMKNASMDSNIFTLGSIEQHSSYE